MLGDANLEMEVHERHVREYARYLKVPSVTDYPELRPILDEGLSAPLPLGWRVVLNDYGSTMYFHEGSGACRTDHPMDEVYRSKCLEVVLVLQNLRQEEEDARRLRGVNGHVHAVGAEFDEVQQQQPSGGERGDSDWSLLEEEFGPATPAVQPPPPPPPPPHPATSGGALSRLGTLVGALSPLMAAANPRSEAPDVDDLIQLEFPDSPPKTSGLTPNAKANTHGGSACPPTQDLPPGRPLPGAETGGAIPTSVTSRNLVARMTNTVNREELLEVQRQVETMKALNEAMRLDLEETKQQVRQVKSDCPEEFLCPIQGEVMADPVVTADGFTYERRAITKWLKRHDRSPCTNQQLEHKHLVPNLALKSQITSLQERLKREADESS